MSFTDFPNGLNSAADYLTNNQSANTRLTTSVANVGRFQVSAETDFNLKEAICSLLAGRGLKLPNINICISLNLKELISQSTGLISDELLGALGDLDSAVDKFNDHLKIDEVLGRVNDALGQVSQIANMINFCSSPIDPIAVPNVLSNTMESFLGTGKDIFNLVGNLIPEEIDGCLLPGGGFNRGIWQGGILGRIDENWDSFITGNSDQAFIDSIVGDVARVTRDVDDLIARENNIQTNYSQGGSDLAEEPRDSNQQVGSLFNSAEEGIRGAFDIANKLYAIELVSGDYQLTGLDGTELEGQVFNGPLELVVDPDLLRILRRPPNPTPDVAEQVPIYNYCNEIIGYQKIETQSDQDESVGLPPGAIDQPGYDAGGLPTSPINEAIAEEAAGDGGTVINNITNNTNIDGATLFAANEAEVLNSGAVEGQQVYREDIGVTYLKNEQQTGDLETDYFVVGGGSGSSTLGPFLDTINSVGGNGILVRQGDNPLYRTIVGTANQITVANGNGTGANPTVALSSNPIIPGTDSVTVPIGTTSQRLTNSNGALRYNTSTNQFEGYQNGGWAGFAIGTSGVNDGANVGGGSGEVYKQNNAGTLEFRTINVSGGLTLGVAGDVITLSENISATNLGAGSEIFASKSGSNLQLRSIVGGAGVTVTQNTNDLTISTEGVITGTATTTDATPTVVLTNTALAAGDAWYFDVQATAKRTDSGAHAGSIKLEGILDNTGGTYDIAVDSANKTVYSGVGTTTGIDVTVDDNGGAGFRVLVTGRAAETFKWAVRVNFHEV